MVGFTKCHRVWVFVTATCMGLIAACFMVAAVFVQHEIAVRMPLSAICFLLIEIVVLLGSILSLAFYTGPDQNEVRS